MPGGRVGASTLHSEWRWPTLWVVGRRRRRGVGCRARERASRDAENDRDPGRTRGPRVRRCRRAIVLLVRAAPTARAESMSFECRLGRSVAPGSDRGSGETRVRRCGSCRRMPRHPRHRRSTCAASASTSGHAVPAPTSAPVVGAPSFASSSAEASAGASASHLAVGGDTPGEIVADRIGLDLDRSAGLLAGLPRPQAEPAVHDEPFALADRHARVRRELPECRDGVPVRLSVFPRPLGAVEVAPGRRQTERGDGEPLARDVVMGVGSHDPGDGDVVGHVTPRSDAAATRRARGPGASSCRDDAPEPLRPASSRQCSHPVRGTTSCTNRAAPPLSRRSCPDRPVLAVGAADLVPALQAPHPPERGSGSP